MEISYNSRIIVFIFGVSDNDAAYKEEAEKKWKQQEDYFDLSTDLAILYKVTSTIEELDTFFKEKGISSEIYE